MENDTIVNEREAIQAHEDRRLSHVNWLASHILESDSKDPTVEHLTQLFNMTTQSLLDHGRVDSGESYDTLDTGENRTVSDLTIGVFQVSKKIIKELGAGGPGHWPGNLDDRERLVDYLNQVADKFEHELKAILETKEVNHG